MSSPFTKFAFYFDGNGKYTHGFGMPILYLISETYIILAIVNTLVNKKKYQKKQKFIILYYTISATLTIIIQFFNPRLLITGFTSAVTFITAYFILLNPMEFMNASRNLYNLDAFNKVINLKKERANRFSIVTIYLPEALIMKTKFGAKDFHNIIDQYFKYVKHACPKIKIYKISASHYAFFCKNETEAYAHIDKIRNEPKDIFMNDSMNDRISVTVNFLLFEDFSDFMKLFGKENTENFFAEFILYTRDRNLTVKAITPVTSLILNDYKRQIEINNCVKEAIKNKSFEIFMQPIYNIHERKFTGAEALIRLKGEDGKYISPLEFIPRAEKNGNIVSIGAIVIEKTFDFINKGKLSERGIKKVNINVSPMQFAQLDFATKLVNEMQNKNIPAQMVRLEITESSTVIDSIHLSQMMNELTTIGIDFALDDFGIGYSNTSRLLDFPFSEIKFDKSLIDSCQSKQGYSLLKYLSIMFKENDKIILAEGVETKETMDIINTMNCDLIQGFYFARPMCFDDFIKFIDEKNK